MNKHVRTAKGRILDMDSLFLANQKSIALGNASLNARGDIVKHGKVVKTVEERREEYDVANKTTKTISLSPDSEILENNILKNVQEIKPEKKSEKKNKSDKGTTVVFEESSDSEKKSKSKVEDESFLGLSDIIKS